MFLSVAICTWNRSALLRQTLEHIRLLRIPPAISFELLVVNNNCTDDTSAIIASFSDCLPVRELHEGQIGQSHARNRAVQEARGDYIVWTDDDVLISPDWLAAYAEAIECWPEAIYFGGPIYPLFAAEPPAWIGRNIDLLEGTYALRDFGPETRPLQNGELPFGANMAFRTDVLREHPFNGALGRAGHEHIRGDETELLRALQDADRLGIWIGGARVKHFIPAERLTLRYIWKFFEGGGRTFVRQKDHAPCRAWAGVPHWAVRQCATAAAKTLVLSPFRSRSWLAAVRDTAKALGTIRESRLQYRSAPRSGEASTH
jgi:glycosyltransferase involved in cell wall biosynthesis